MSKQVSVFKTLIDKEKLTLFQMSQLSLTRRIPRKRTNVLIPVIKLVPPEPVEVPKEKLITFPCYTKALVTPATPRVSTRAAAPELTTTPAATYRLTVKRFEDEGPLAYIEVRKRMDEIWKQNGMTDPEDRLNNIKSILEGQAKETF